MRYSLRCGLTGAAVLATALTTSAALATDPVARATAAAQAEKPSTGRVFIVQALPDTDVSITVGQDETTTGVGTADIVGPLRLPPGRHEITVEGTSAESWEMQASVDVAAGQSVDVVIHRPASPAGEPIATVYQAPLAPVKQRTGRVLLAHTATVPPADIKLDGKVAFANIANGEFVEAEVPAGKHSAAIVPTGQKGPALLGPLTLEVPELTLTSVYAIGRPQNGSMDVVVHQIPLPMRGSAAPDDINTGSAGLVAGEHVTEFGSTTVRVAEAGSTLDANAGGGTLAGLLGLFGATGLAGAGVAILGRRPGASSGGGA
jgi:hypothetical protein